MKKSPCEVISIQRALTLLEQKISVLLAQKERVTVAIDGRCGAGKTTLATALATQFYPCNLIHMDDFFLRPEQRTAQRFCTAGENIDHERFLEEVLLPLRTGLPFSYSPFDCHTQALRAPVRVTPTQVTVVEGSYSCHRALQPFYDLRIFLDVDKKTQANRLLAREGKEGAVAFWERWVPLEEAYFAMLDQHTAFDIRLTL